jgi:copper(I)-binding protein
MSSRRALVLRTLTLLVLLPAVLAACASGGTGTPAVGAPTAADAWIRPPMAAGLPAAGYVTLTGSGTDDQLVAVATASADRVELHRSMAGEGGMMGMEPVDAIAVAATTTVRLEPGGLHLMLFGFEAAVGSTVELELTFGSGSAITVPAEVRPS